MEQQQRYALVIGNENYDGHLSLENPVCDAISISKKLASLGFNVREEHNVKAEHLRTIISDFFDSLRAIPSDRDNKVGLIYFSGHGVQVDGENYLIPVDANISSRIDLKLNALQTNHLLEGLEVLVGTSILLLDCCRDSPFPRQLQGRGTRSAAVNHGLAELDAPRGSFIAYATQPDNVALDGKGDHSPFSNALLDNIEQPDCSISEMMINVRRSVYEQTDGRQMPWDRSALFSPFAFNLKDNDIALEEKDEALQKGRENEYWGLISQTDNVDLYRSFLVQFPRSQRRAEVMQAIDQIHKKMWIGKIFKGAMITFVSGVLLVLAYIGSMWMLFKETSGQDLVGGDISIDLTRKYMKTSSAAQCRFRCIMTSNCVAYTYNTKDKKCYSKSDVFHYENSKIAISGYLRKGLFRRSPIPKKSPYNYSFGVRLIGPLLDFTGTTGANADLNKSEGWYWRDYGLKVPEYIEQNGKRETITSASVYCEKKCVELTNCVGFTVMEVGTRCKLFSKVMSSKWNPAKLDYIPVPSSYSGVKIGTELTAPITKEEDSELLSPVTNGFEGQRTLIEGKE